MSNILYKNLEEKKVDINDVIDGDYDNNILNLVNCRTIMKVSTKIKNWLKVIKW